MGKTVKVLIMSVCFILSGILKLYAQQTVKKERILIILDASASMQQQWQDSLTRFKAASAFIMQLMDSVYARNNEVEFALRVYGHQYPAGQNNCYDTRLEVMYSMDNYTQMSLRLASLHTIGVTPVSFAISEALDYDMSDVDRYNYHMVIITDGAESCGGNLCTLTKKIKDKHIPSPCIVSVASDAVLRKQYSCLGNYNLMLKNSDIAATIHQMLNGCCTVPYLVKNKIVFGDVSVHKKEAVTHAFQPLQKKAQDSVVLDSKTTEIKPVIESNNTAVISNIKVKEEIEGFGDLKIVDISKIKRIALFYEESNNFIPLNKMNIDQLYLGQVLKLKSGNYKIEYDAFFAPQVNRHMTKTFTIVKEMITEIRLD